MKFFRSLILIGILIAIQNNFHAYGFDNLVNIAGTVRNNKNKKTIENVSLSVPGSNISTVTNAEGEFILKIPASMVNHGIKAEQIGFKSQFLSEDEYKGREEITIFLEPTERVLKEVVVLGGDPKEIVRTAIKKIPENYSDKENMLTGFYRETIRKGNRYVSINEGLVDVLKKPYRSNRNTWGDKVSINKGRSLLSQKASDTLAVKLAGGPYMPIVFDVVKNGDHLFTEDEMGYFEFKMEKGAMIDERLHYTISFKPIVELSYPLHKGLLFIDAETMAISRAEFELDMKDKNKVSRSILEKKPAGLHFKPEEVSGVVTYRFKDGKTYLNYIESKIKFKCDWKKKLFSTSYTTEAEMVMVDRDENPEKHIKFKDSFNKRKIFSDIVENYWEEDFWKDYNIIEPTESLEKAVEKLKKN
ncbi:MAG: carboxypeptidase-like regulatory domain-containing protein [Muribaculaceae bacterium]|nr:carboxypeptidase-like regulatory domain-containing protein [Muribaculaceae bacterium]